MEGHNTSTEQSNFVVRFSEGIGFEAEVAELARQYGWSSSSFGPHPAAKTRPHIPQWIGPDGKAIRTPDLLLEHKGLTGKISRAAEVKKKAVSHKSADYPYYPLDDFRMEYAGEWQGATGIPVFFIFWNDTYGWRCASRDRLLTEDTDMVKMPKSSGDPNTKRTYTRCHKLKVSWFQPLTSLLCVTALGIETTNSIFANGRPL